MVLLNCHLHVVPAAVQSQFNELFWWGFFSSQDTGHDSDTSGRTASPGAPGSTGRRRGGRNDDPPQRGILDAVKERLQPVASYEQDDEYFHR